MITFLEQIVVSWQVVSASVLMAFITGLLLKNSIIRKQRKRILSLEDEMLSNLARILALQKKISEERKNINGYHQTLSPIRAKQ
jgi:hypothetical protein